MDFRPLRNFGTATLYNGPMTAGKSDHLIADVLRRIKYGKQYGEIYRPTASKRDDHNRHESRTGISALCTYFNSLAELEEMMDYRANFVAIDEIHFLQDPITFVMFIDGIQQRGQDAIIGGVDVDFLGRAFPVVTAARKLKNIRVEDLLAWCTVCGFEAPWSQLMGDPPVDGSTIQTGYDYEARCTTHFEPRIMRA